MFKWITGTQSFGVPPYLATILLGLIHTVEDFAVYQRIKQIGDDASETLKKGLFTPELRGRVTYIFGRIIGILVAGYLFVDW